MEVKYTSQCGRYEVLFDEKDQQGLFTKIAKFQEVFEDDANVVIDSVAVPATDIRYCVRTVDGNEFYEKRYSGQNSKLFGYKREYGSSKENKGALFPKRKDKNGNYHKNDGWYKWERDDSQPEAKKEGKAPF